MKNSLLTNKRIIALFLLLVFLFRGHQNTHMHKRAIMDLLSNIYQK